jgi:transcriptional regulator with XRE-family HTH domain
LIIEQAGDYGMQNLLGEIIQTSRRKRALTQSKFGTQYRISGPAVFKFEKGYATPSLNLWLKMAEDADIPQRKAVLIWIRNHLPAPFQQYIVIPDEPISEAQRKHVLALLKKNRPLPTELQDLLEDEEFWQLYKPTAVELRRLCEIVSVLGSAPKQTYCDMLLLIRDFLQS